MPTEAPAKPSYLGLLNAVSLAESNAGVYLDAWANATPDPDLANCLRFVAARERSHGDVFCRRIGELGFSLMQKPDPGAAERIAKYANPKITDLEKIGSERDEADPFQDMERQCADGMFDPLTAKLITWYIAEERDSGAVLKDAYAKVRARSSGHSTNGSGPSSDAQAIMDCMTAGFARLEKTLEKFAKAK
jgi:rubrerythrin